MDVTSGLGVANFFLLFDVSANHLPPAALDIIRACISFIELVRLVLFFDIHFKILLPL